MKLLGKSFFTLCSILLITASSNAENKTGELGLFFLAGYGIPMGGYTEGDLISVNSSGDEKDHYLNYGQGIQMKLGADYFITHNIGMQFSFCYTGGLPSIKVVVDDDDDNFTEKYKHNTFGVNIMLVPHFEAFQLLDMYTGLGIGVTFASLNIDNDDKENYPNEGYFKTSPALTFSGILGTDVSLNDKWNLFFELSFDQMSFRLKSRKETDENSSQIDYVKDSDTSPAPIKIPGSNFGLRVGIRVAILDLAKTPEVF